MNFTDKTLYKLDFKADLDKFADKLKAYVSTDMSIIVPPIKSQGIKTKLVPWIMDLAPKVSGKWIEPFLGTGVVAFNSGYKKAILNDTNPHIINFYKGIQDKVITAPLMKQYLEKEGAILSAADNNGYEHYLRVRTRFNSGEFSPYDFIFLSRAGFNGMMRFGSKGNWNIPFCKKPDRFAQAYVTKITNQVANVSQIIQQEPDWIFYNKSFQDIIPLATENDIIYCDPPYYGRHVDYYNGWTEKDEALLFDLLMSTKAKFILSTWHHNDWRENEMIKKFWDKFNIVTKDHFYHNGGSIENRRTIVEALVCNFDTNHFEQHNHGAKEKIKIKQLAFEWAE
jgi:DNA adenine methylase